MPKAPVASFAGRSGTAYSFEVYGRDTRFRDAPAIYVFTRREPGRSGGFSHELLYIGQTATLGTRISSHEKWPCVERAGCNCICTLVESSESRRLAIETDLRQAFATPCNDQ